MKKLWTDKAWENYLFWQTQDKKTLIKLNKLIMDIERNPHIRNALISFMPFPYKGYYVIYYNDHLVRYAYAVVKT